MSTQSNQIQAPVVLLVDDQPMVAEGIRRMLAGQSDIRFHYCDTSLRAVEMAAAIKPTVILQDLIMPDLDGYKLLQCYRQHKRTKNVPVIVLSTKDDPQDKSLAFEQGANDYLVKLPDKIELAAETYATRFDPRYGNGGIQGMADYFSGAGIFQSLGDFPSDSLYGSPL